MVNTTEILEAVLDNLKTLITDTSLGESFFEKILMRLDSFGYVFDVAADGWMLAFQIKKTEQDIVNYCNVPEIPAGLYYVAVDMVCGNFLRDKKQSGNLSLEGLDFDGAVTSIKTGDTSVNFDASSSDEGKFNALVDALVNRGRGDLLRYRRMQW